jgi:hypothetical protein
MKMMLIRTGMLWFVVVGGIVMLHTVVNGQVLLVGWMSIKYEL